jgi:hypothetical protein
VLQGHPNENQRVFLVGELTIVRQRRGEISAFSQQSGKKWHKVLTGQENDNATPHPIVHGLPPRTVACLASYWPAGQR